MGPEFKSFDLKDCNSSQLDVGDRVKRFISSSETYANGTVIGTTDQGQILVGIDKEYIRPVTNAGYALFSSDSSFNMFDEFGNRINNHDENIFVGSAKDFMIIKKVSRLKKIDVHGNLW